MANNNTIDPQSQLTPYHIHNGIDSPLIDKNANNLTIDQLLPSETGNSGKFLTTNGTTASWGTVTIPVKFGGTGADGALVTSSTNVVVDCGAGGVVIKNYSSISITGTGYVTFTNPAATGTKVIFLCSGACTMTSSAAHVIDLRGLGGAGGNGICGTTIAGSSFVATPGAENNDDGITPISNGKFGKGSANNDNGGDTVVFGGGGASNYTVGTTGNAGGRTIGAGGGATGSGNPGTVLSGISLYLVGAQPYLGIRGFCSAGAGGGGGSNGVSAGGSSTAATNGTGGTLGSPDGGAGNAAATGGGSTNFGGCGGGGAGGGSFYMEVAGAFNFTTGTLDCSGGVGGGGGVATTNGYGGSGGGGGSGGTCIIYYNTLTANSGTVKVTGGSGGTGATGNNGNGQSGGNGGSGFSYVGLNQWFL